MRRENYVGAFESGMDEGLIFENVQGGAGDLFRFEGRDECRFINDGPADTRCVAFNTSQGSPAGAHLVLNDPEGARELRGRLWAEHLQLDHIDPAIMADPAAGFALWQRHAQENEAAWKQHARPVSRVFPLRLFHAWNTAGRRPPSHP